jgi:hypothetical protein
MSIKIDPETDKAVNPESIGKNDLKKLVTTVAVVIGLSVVYYFIK